MYVLVEASSALFYIFSLYLALTQKKKKLRTNHKFKYGNFFFYKSGYGQGVVGAKVAKRPK